MRRERRLAAALVALLTSLAGSFAVASPAKPARAVNPVSEALCGRGRDFRANLAKALDQSNPIALSSPWRNAEIDNFHRWLDAPPCQDAKAEEIKRYNSRHQVLEQLGRRLERVRVTDPIGLPLAQFRGWRPGAVDWPELQRCQGCAVLRSAGARVADIATRWPARASARLGDRLAEAAQRESLVAELCAARPSPGAREDLETRFRYYSWTPGGAKLLAVAAWFEQPEVAAACPGR